MVALIDVPSRKMIAQIPTGVEPGGSGHPGLPDDHQRPDHQYDAFPRLLTQMLQACWSMHTTN